MLYKPIYIYVNINQIQNNVYQRGIEEIHITRVLQSRQTY